MPTTPRVAVDVTPLAGPRTGIGLSVEETLAALSRLEQPPQIVPYALGLRTPRYRAHLPAGTRIVRIPTRALLAMWGRGGHPRLDPWLRGAQVVHATNYIVPPSAKPTIVTVNDCGFALYPETVDEVVAQFGAVLRRAIARGAVVHVTTDHVAGEVDELFGPGLREQGRIAVVPFGIPDLGPPAELPADLAARLDGRRYVVAIGTIEPRKNIARLVEAFGAVAASREDLRLVLAGRDAHGRPAVDAALARLSPEVRDRVLLTGTVTHAVRRALLERATVLAYPSLYEGFGFPMLEAMTLGVPVLATRAGALPEVAGGAAEMADPLDPSDLARGLARLLDDDAHRQQLAELGRARAAHFTWDATARGLAALYARVAGQA